MKFRLGYVDDPLPGHEMYRGMLSIPYLRWSPGSGFSVAQIRFRCLKPGCKHEHHGKYNTVSGDTPRLYNTISLLGEWDEVAVCEGEIDAITATVCGVPSVGVAGVECWKTHFTLPLLGYRTVFILEDGDSAGAEFGKKLAGQLPNAKRIPMPQGEDVNDLVKNNTKRALLERMGRGNSD